MTESVEALCGATNECMAKSCVSSPANSHILNFPALIVFFEGSRPKTEDKGSLTCVVTVSHRPRMPVT